MKRLLCLLILMLSGLAAAQEPFPTLGGSSWPYLICFPTFAGGSTTQLKTRIIDTPGDAVYYIFRSPTSNALNSVTYFNGTSNGGTTTGIGTIDVFAWNAATGLPTGATLANNTFSPAALNGQATITITSPPTLTSGSYYCVRLTNNNAAPGTNFYGLPIGSIATSANYNQYASDDAVLAATTHDGGTTLSAPAPCLPFVLTFATYGDYKSRALGNANNNSTNAVKLYNTSGSRVAQDGPTVSFSGVAPKLWNVTCSFSVTGAPTYALQCEILNTSNTVLATSSNTWSYGTNAALSARFYFSSAYTFSAGTTYRIVVTPVLATAGDSSNYYQLADAAALLTNQATYGSILGMYGSTATSPSWTRSGEDANFNLWLELPMGTGTGGGSSIISGGEVNQFNLNRDLLAEMGYGWLEGVRA